MTWCAASRAARARSARTPVQVVLVPQQRCAAGSPRRPPRLAEIESGAPARYASTLVERQARLGRRELHGVEELAVGLSAGRAVHAGPGARDARPCAGLQAAVVICIHRTDRIAHVADVTVGNCLSPGSRPPRAQAASSGGGVAHGKRTVVNQGDGRSNRSGDLTLLRCDPRWPWRRIGPQRLLHDVRR